MRKLATLAAVFAAATFGLAGVAKADTTAFGPLEYLCFDTATTTAVGDCDGKDSPFADLDFSGGYFHLWTFETGSIGTPSVPGVTLVGTALSIHCGPTSTDSVDEDDGFIDGSGNDGCSLFDSPGTDGITFEFDETTLGMFPTHIGIVWTDGLNDAGFDVLDESGSAIDCAPTETTTGTFDGFNGDTDEDRFFGCFNDSGISEFTIKMVGNLGTGIEVDHLQYGKIPELEPEASLTKVLTSGPDGDETPPFDLAVQIGQLVTSHYDFTITYEPNGDTTPVVVLDTLPAEWVVDEVEGTSTASLAPRSPVLDIPDLDGGTGSVDVSKNGKGAKSKSATSLAWTPDPTIATSDIRVDATTRQSPGKRNVKYAPTSCGRLALNDGAIAFEVDPQTGELVLRQDGEPGGETTGDNLQVVVIAGPTDPIILVALDGNFDLDGGGDLDLDGLTDLDEVSHEDPDDDTDPCLIDTDDDGVNDGDGQGSQLDLCPNQGPPNSAAGELLDSDGCIFLAQCSDTVDNDSDGVTDFSGGDASCDTADDDSEDSFDDADSDGVGDGVDSCPNEGPADAGQGEILKADGCIRQSQCSDGIDNDNDGPIDFAGNDASCDNIIDDSEDTADN